MACGFVACVMACGFVTSVMGCVMAALAALAALVCGLMGRFTTGDLKQLLFGQILDFFCVGLSLFGELEHRRVKSFRL
jgi:hypothetical protein